MGGGLSKTPYKGMEQKRGEGKQRFPKGGLGKLDQGMGALKREGAGTPLRTWVNIKPICKRYSLEDK